MSASVLLRRVLVHKIPDLGNLIAPLRIQVQPNRSKFKLLKLPKPDCGFNFRRVVHFKDEYTVEPLNVTNLAGRDPVTGRVIVGGWGGGIKHKYHWINWIRDGPTDLNEKPKEEVVLDVFVDGCRTAYVALVGCGSELKYILATEKMKPGDIIRTHRGIPRNPVRANEGDAFPLGALPEGTMVHCVEKYPGAGGGYIHAAGSYGTITHRDPNNGVVVRLPSKRILNLHQNCMAVVGRLSHLEHSSTPIGSATRLRELGCRPRSGLWQRKTGRFGRKIKPPPKLKHVRLDDTDPPYEKVTLTLKNHE